MAPGEPVPTAIVGLGRSGWKKHAQAMLRLPELFRVVSVADLDADRRREAELQFGCRSFPSLNELLAEDPAELIVIATPSHLHAAQAIAALSAGKMVVCEKPMALDLGEVDAMTDVAERTGNLLTVFNNYRFECDFLVVREIMAGGRLGKPLSIKLSEHRFVRRHDWQAVSRLGGGALRNTCWHLIDQALVLIGAHEPPAQIVAHLGRALSPGDGEDYVKVVLRYDGLPIVDIEVSDVSPFPQFAWTVTGSRGCLAGDHRELSWRYVRESELRPLAVSEGPAPGREYRFDRPRLHEEVWRAPASRPSPAVAYYRRLYQTIRHGAALAVTPRSCRLVMAVIEGCLRTMAVRTGG